MWFTAPALRYVPRLDLQLLTGLIKYKDIERKKKTNALKKLSNYLWYLSEELRTFASFGEDVPIETKNKTRKALNDPSEQSPIKRTTIDP